MARLKVILYQVCDIGRGLWLRGGRGREDSEIRARLEAALESLIVAADPLAVGFGMTGVTVELQDVAASVKPRTGNASTSIIAGIPLSRH